MTDDDKEFVILFICSGNTCRSPMAEKILEDMLSDSEVSGRVRVFSAGLNAFSGGELSLQARKIMQKEGVEISNHQVRPVNEEMLEGADLILTMTVQHKMSIFNLFPEIQKQKIYTLKEFAEDTDLLDQRIKKIDRLSSILKRERQKVLNSNKDKLERLKSRKKELQKELDEVNEKIEDINRKLSETEKPYKRKISKIQEKNRDFDISDPYGYPDSIYRTCFYEIKKTLKKVKKELLNILNDKQNL